MDNKIGIALSGGGARGIMHLGVLKALNENGIYPDKLSGSSAGAIVSAFYAADYPIADILKIFKETKVFGFSNFNLKKEGLFNLNIIEQTLLKYFPHNYIQNLPKEIFITITDIQNGKAMYLNQGKLSEALMATSAIPFLFQPVNIQNTVGVDGGVINNLPIEPLREKCNLLIGSYCNSLHQSTTKLNAAEIIDRSIHLSMLEIIEQKAKQCDLFLQAPDMTRYNIFDLNKADEIFKYAYDYCNSKKENLKSLLKKIEK
ncbi:MAG: patatin-like phospholipase family protein [Sphingobacteriaceae bacterium]|nr:patatin-like phospholipase family protein [Sphingobacteriaceae bacterium]